MKDVLFKILVNIGIPHVLRRLKYKNKTVTILCLHRISDEDSVTFHPFKIKDFEKLCHDMNFIIRKKIYLTNKGKLAGTSGGK